MTLNFVDNFKKEREKLQLTEGLDVGSVVVHSDTSQSISVLFSWLGCRSTWRSNHTITAVSWPLSWGPGASVDVRYELYFLVLFIYKPLSICKCSSELSQRELFAEQKQSIRWQTFSVSNLDVRLASAIYFLRAHVFYCKINKDRML